jgi:hypothetical protein
LLWDCQVPANAEQCQKLTDEERTDGGKSQTQIAAILRLSPRSQHHHYFMGRVRDAIVV